MSVESLTYADLADRLGTTLEAARSLVRRLRLPRQTGNDGKVRINVDFAEIQYRPLPARSPGGGASSCQSVFPHPAQASTIPASCCFSSRGNNEREAMKLILSTRPLLSRFDNDGPNAVAGNTRQQHREARPSVNPIGTTHRSVVEPINDVIARALAEPLDG
jgi:hypothetical protein